MATEAGIPAPICETRTEERAKIEEQATNIQPNKLPNEEPNRPDQLTEETFEDDQILGTASINKISSEANHVSSSEVAENSGQTVTNDTETLFLSDQIDDQPLENAATSTKDTSSEELSHNENTTAEGIVDATCTKNDLRGATRTKQEDSEKLLVNTLNDSQVEVQSQSITLNEAAETHTNLTTTEKTGENLSIQVEDSQMKDGKRLGMENDDTSRAEVITVPDKIIFEEEVLKEQTQKPEELAHAAEEDIKQSSLGQDTETKNALKDAGFTAESREILDKKTEETVKEVEQTEERPAVQNVQTPVSDEKIEDKSMIKVEETGEKNEECSEKEITDSFANKTLMKGETDEEVAIHEPSVAKEDQLKSGLSETRNNTLLDVGPQIEKPEQSLQDGSEENRAAVSSQIKTETISPVQNLAMSPREIPDDQTEEETHENISNTGENICIQVGGLETEVEDHFNESEKPSLLKTCGNNTIGNEDKRRSELFEKEEQNMSNLMMEETAKETAVESMPVASDDVNVSTLSQDDGTENSLDIPPLENLPPEENHVKGILENVEVDCATTTAESSEENLRTCLQNVEAKESIENAKEETIHLLKSESLDKMNSYEVAADEVNPEASKPNDDIKEHSIVNEEVSYDKSPVLPGAKESEIRVPDSLLSTPLSEVRLDEKTNYVEDLDIPAEKLSYTEEGSAETLTSATSDKDEHQDFMENTTQEEVRSHFNLEDNYESQSNPTATEKSGNNSPIQVEECLEKENQKPALTETTCDYIKDDASTVTENVEYEEEVALQKEEMVNPEELLQSAFNDDKGEYTDVNCSSQEESYTAEARELVSSVTEERAADVVASKEETFENISITEETGENSKTDVGSLVKNEEFFEKKSTESSTSKAPDPVKDDSIHDLKVENDENMVPKVATQTEKLAEPLKDSSKGIETAVSSQDNENTIYLEQNIRADPQENLNDQIENQTMDVEKGETLENIAKTEVNPVIQVKVAKMELEEHFDNTEKPSLTETCNRDAILLEDDEKHESTILTEDAKEKTPVESLHVAHEKIKADPLSPDTDDKVAESHQARSAATIVPSEEGTEENSPIQDLKQDSKETSLENADLLETMHEAETGDRGLQKEDLLCSERTAESTSLEKEVKLDVPTEHLEQTTESIEPSNLDQDSGATSSLVEERHNANQQELVNERQEKKTAEAVDRKEENVERQDFPTTASSEQTGGNLLTSETESIVSHEPKIEECLGKENYNTSTSLSDASEVTDNIKSEKEMAKPDELLHATVDDIKASSLSEDTETKYILQYGSPTEEQLEKLSDGIGERAADVVVKEEISENISIAASNKETEYTSKTESEDSQQVKHEKYPEKESAESYTSDAIVKDDSIEELKTESEENSLLNTEAQPEKHAQSIQDIGTAVSIQNIEQKLRADPHENLDDLIENQTVDVEKCKSLENMAKSEDNSVTQSNGSEMELEEQFNNSKTPSFTETSDKDAIEDEGLRRSILLENKEYKECTSLKGDDREEKPVDSLHVAHEDIQSFASRPCTDEKEVESLKSQSAATFVFDEGTSSMQHLTKDGEKPSSANADLPEHIHEAYIRGGDLQNEELFCSAKNVESTLLKEEVHIDEPIEHLDTTLYTAEESLDANRQELLGERTEDRTDDATERKERTAEDVPKATASEQIEGNPLSSNTLPIVSHEAEVEEVPTDIPSEQTEGNSLICDAEPIISRESNIDSTSDLSENTLLDVEAETEKPVQTTNIVPEDNKTIVSSQNTDGTYLVDEKPLNADPNKTLDLKIEATATDTEIKETSEDVATSISNDETIEDDVLIQVDGSQHKQKENNKEGSEQCSTEHFTRDIHNDDKSIITDKLKDGDEDLNKAELVQSEGNRDCTLLEEEAWEEKPVESLHSSPEYYNSLEKDVDDEKSIECVKDALRSHNTGIEKKISDKVEPVVSLHVLEDEVAKENNDQQLTQDREIEKKVEPEKLMEYFHALDGDKSSSQTIEVVKEEKKEDAFHGDDKALRQDVEVAKDEIKEEDTVHVALEDRALSQDNEAVKEETDDAIITESMHVPRVEDKASHQVVDVENEDAELKPLESSHAAHENDNSTGQDTKLSKEENFVMSLPVVCEEENSLSRESEIAKAETESMLVRSLDVALEDDKSSSHKTEVTGKESNVVETLSVAPDHEALSPDILAIKDEGIVESTHVALEHDIASCQDMEVVKEELEVEKPLESLHAAPKDDEALCQDKEVINQKTEEDYSECVNIAPRDDKPLSMEAETKEVDEQNHAESFYVSTEKDNESNKDSTPANEDLAEQFIESSQIATTYDRDYTPAKEDEENIVTSHQLPEHLSIETKEDVNDVFFQSKVQDEPETAKQGSGTDMPVIDDQYNDTPHSIDTEVTAHKSVDSVQETMEIEGKNTSDNIGTVHDGQKIADGYGKEEIIYHQSEERDFASAQITQEGCGEVTDTAENSAIEVKEMMPCEDEKKIIELDTEEKGKDVQHITNPDTEGSDATEEVAVSISEDFDCNEKEFSSTELSEEAQVSHEKSVIGLVPEASEEEKSDHNNVRETGYKEGPEVKKLEELEEESTTISTKENVEMCGASMEASEITQEMPKVEVCQTAANETLETKEITTKEIETEFLPREAELLEDQTTTEGEPLQNEEAETDKEGVEEVREHKKLLECTPIPIMVEAESKDLPELSDEKNGFQEICSTEIVKDEDGDAIEVTSSDISQSTETLVPARLEEVLDSVSQEQNCNVISEAKEAELANKKVEAAPAEVKPDIVSEEAPKEPTYKATETVAEVSREKIHEEDQDTENNNIGSCEEETLRGSCQENEANQGEDEFEFVINRYEDKEVKNPNIEFEERSNKVTADSVDSLAVNAAGQELEEKTNEETVLDAKPSETTQETIDGCETNGGYTNTTTMMHQDDAEIKHEIPEGSLEKEREEWDKNDENCTSDKVDLNDENTDKLEAEKSDEEKTDTLVRLTEDDSKRTEAAKSETPVEKQVEPEVKYTENVDNDGSVCDKNILASESIDSIESSSQAKTETAKPSKQEETDTGNEKQISNDKTEEIKKSEPAEVQAPSLSDLIHKVPAKEPPTYEKESKPEKTHEAEHEKSKSDEEKEDEEECAEHQKSDTSSDAPVMVEAGDADVKIAHKKSHNLLSGVGSKVKHSIAKVKKAITGKSSQPKPTSPK